MSLLDKLLSSQVRSEIFQLLFDQRKRSFYLRDLHRRSGLALRTIQIEIEKLKNLDLVVSRRDGNRLYFSANVSHPLYNDLCRLVEKTAGIKFLLTEKLNELPGVKTAFVFGSVAKGTEGAESDVDLVVIGEVSLRSLSSLLKDMSNQIEREINPHIYSEQGFKDRLAKKDHFLTSLKSEKKIFLIGDENVFE
jgi:predicted nucleotidyltransferase